MNSKLTCLQIELMNTQKENIVSRGPKTFFTSDTHFGHANIIKYCNRPFKSVEEMDEALIKNWNDKVQVGDTVYHLGDFSFGPAEKYASRLNGMIRFVRGNHDRPLEAYLNCKYFQFPDVLSIYVGKQQFFLSHYAHRVWPKSHRGTWHLYGHSHGTLPDDPDSMSFDCGVDCHNYAPLEFEEVKAIMEKKTFKPKDHHS